MPNWNLGQITVDNLHQKKDVLENSWADKMGML